MALTCSLTHSRDRLNSCGYSLNSVKDIYLANLQEVASIGYVKDTDSGYTGEISGVTLTSGATWYHLAPSTDSASYTDALVVGSNGNRYRTHSLNFSLGGDYDKNAVLDLHALSLGEFIGIGVTASGSWVLLGTETVGLKASTAQLVGSATASDFSGMEIAMTADVTLESMPLTEGAISAIKNSLT